MITGTQYQVLLRSSSEHPHQAALIETTSKRLIVRAGRRGGKTVGAATRAVRRFLEGRRQLYATPTSEQLGKFWFEVKRALAQPIQAGILKCNESEHFIELPGTERRIKGKTAWNADTLRGDYADDLYFDEWQLMDEDAWEVVGAPMLADNNGDAVFIYTPPSLRSAGVSKARDPRHASKMFKAALADTTGRWEAIHFASHENPFISQEALSELMADMSRQSYRQEILAEDDELEAAWLVYKAFNEHVCKIPRFPIPETWLCYSFHDFGAANPAALFVAQDPATGNFYEWHEYLPGSGRSTAEHVAAFKDICTERKVIFRVGGSHQEEEIRQGYGAHGWPIIEPKIRLVKAQVDKVIGMMELNKIFIFADLTNRLEEIMSCLWEPREDGKPGDKIKDEARFHLCAAARYGYSQFSPETAIQFKPSQNLRYARV